MKPNRLLIFLVFWAALILSFVFVKAFNGSGESWSSQIGRSGSYDIVDPSGGQLYSITANYTIYFPQSGRVCAYVNIFGTCVNIPSQSFDVYTTVQYNFQSTNFSANDYASLFWDTQSNGGSVDATTEVRKVEILSFSSNQSSAEVGQSFSVNWNTDEATSVDLLWGGPLQGGSGSGEQPNDGSKSFTCSSVGTATFELRAEGPTASGLNTINQIITVDCVPAGGGASLPGSFNLSGSCSAVNSSTNSADLSWWVSSNADSYKVERKAWSTGSWGQVGTTTGTSFSENVSNGADYYYRVFAINTAGSTFSSPTELFVCGAVEGGAPPPDEPPPPPPSDQPPPPPPNEAVLYVNSSGASGVTIGYVGGTSGTNGTTNYSRSYTSNISTRIRATSAAPNGAGFSSWSGCDSVQNPRDCTVAVNTGNSKTVTANYIIQNEPPPFPPPPPSLTCVAFKANDGVHYMVAEGGGGPGYTINANRTAIGDWEKFSVVDRGGGKVALKTFNNYYAVAEGGGGGAFNADRTSIGAWEEFRFVDAGSGKTAIKTDNGHYVVAEGGGGGAANADRTAIGGWEMFDMVPTSGCSSPDQTPIGYLDEASCDLVRGWSFDPDTSSSEIAVQIYKDGPVGSGTLVANTSTTDLRQDVNSAYGITGNHGYAIGTPASLKDGNSHTVYAYGINTNAGGNNTLLTNSPKTVFCPVTTVTISANPTSVAYAGSSTISWSSSNATSCTASGDWSGSKPLSGNQPTGNLTQVKTYTYTLTCSGNGSDTKSATVTVSPPLSPAINLLYNGIGGSTTVGYNSKGTLSWTTGGTISSCTASSTAGDFSGTKGTSGSESKGPVTSSRTYTLSCVGPTGLTGSDSVIVNVPAPTVDIKANGSNGPVTLAWNSSANLSWTSTNAGSCVATGDWSGSKAISGSQSTGNLTQVKTYTYTLTCSGNGSVSDAVQIILHLPAPNDPTNVTVTQPNYCFSGPAATVGWNYSDPSGSPQSAYQVQIDDQASFNSPEVDSGKVTSTSTSYASPQGLMTFDATYRARVRVWNQYDVPSAWVTSSTWKTPKNAYPQVNFTSPATVKIDDPVQFTDQTIFYDGKGDNNHSWNWLFGDGGSSNQKNPTHTYTTPNLYNVSLTAADNNGFACGITKPINIRKPIPLWKEVAPR